MFKQQAARELKRSEYQGIQYAQPRNDNGMVIYRDNQGLARLRYCCELCINAAHMAKQGREETQIATAQSRRNRRKNASQSKANGQPDQGPAGTRYGS